MSKRDGELLLEDDETQGTGDAGDQNAGEQNVEGQQQGDAQLDANGDDVAEQAEADFTAGFDAIHKPESEHSQADDEGEESESPASKWMTKEEVDALVAGIVESNKNEVRKLHGHIGSLKDRVEGSLKPREISLQKLREEFPDLASILEEDLKEGIVGGSSALAMTEEQIESIVASRVESAMKGALLDYEMDRNYPGWKEKFNTPEFQAWMKSSLTEDQTKAMDREPAAFVAQLKAHDEIVQKAAATEAAKVQRLRGSMPVKGGAPTSSTTRNVSDEDAFEAGFKSVHGQRR